MERERGKEKEDMGKKLRKRDRKRGKENEGKRKGERQ